MKERLSAWWSGSGDDARLRRVGPEMRFDAYTSAVSGVAAGTIGAVVFGWDVSELLLGAAAGTAIVGAFEGLGLLKDLPGPRLPPPPAGMAVADGPAPRPRWWLLAPLLLAFVWLADRFDLGPVLLPGLFLGRALANAVCAVIVGRWEREHDAELLVLDGRGADGQYARPRAGDGAPVPAA